MSKRTIEVKKIQKKVSCFEVKKKIPIKVQKISQQKLKNNFESRKKLIFKNLQNVLLSFEKILTKGKKVLSRGKKNLRNVNKNIRYQK